MKTWLLFLLILLNSMIIHAQKNFEGKIVYRSDAAGAGKKDATVEVFLKGHKMLLNTVDKEDKTGTLSCLYDFEKGTCYTFLSEDSTVLTNSFGQDFTFMQKMNENDTTDNLFNISGYQAKKVAYQQGHPTMISFKKIEAWFCDELIFKVPDSIQSIAPPIVVFNGNTISLKMMLSMEGIPDSSSLGPITVLIYASEITKMSLADSFFEIPPYFKIMDRNEHMNQLMRKFNEINSELPKTVPLPDSPDGNKPH
jgi:hypothetical protein